MLYIGARRRRLGRRSLRQRAEPRHATSARSCASTWTAARPFAVPRRQPVRGQRGRAPRRSGPTACATPGASPSTARPATSTSATSARTRSRRWTSASPRGAAARTTAGTSRRAPAASAPPPAAPPPGITLPVVEYGRGDGCSITGGVVYRGCRMPGYHGTYFYGDFCSGVDPLVPPPERPGRRSARLDGRPRPRRRTPSAPSAWTPTARSTSSTTTARSTGSPPPN